MKVLFLLTIVLCLASVAFAEGMIAKDYVEAHNKWRSQVDVDPVTWSAALAQDAQAWAETLKQQGGDMKHASDLEHGENLYKSGAQMTASEKDANGNWIWEKSVHPMTATDVVDAWSSEKKDYTYSSNTCSEGKVCGHYTQVVWAKSTEIGCGHVVNDDMSQLVVCRYDPPGNIIGQKPY